MDVAMIPVDERLLALEPRKDDLPSARRLSGFDTKTSRCRLERVDDVGKAGRWSLRGGGVRPSTHGCERQRHDDLHRVTSSDLPLEDPAILREARHRALVQVCGLELRYEVRRYRV